MGVNGNGGLMEMGVNGNGGLMEMGGKWKWGGNGNGEMGDFPCYNS